MKLGVAYYPEQWPKTQWPVDARMMAELGLTYVRLGEFAWSLLEPSEGQFHFDWLEQAIAVLQAETLQVILGTPTAAPPPWLTSRYDIFQRDANRTVLGAGSRRHACANNPYFLQASGRVVTKLAHHFGKHQVVVGWQIDNEFGCHRTGRCFCEYCHAAFHAWLKNKYVTLDQLNAAWGTTFWSAVYTNWSQIPLPWISPAPHNPSLQLDFRRFSSDSWVNYQRRQIEILRQHIADQFVTHNFMGSGEGTVDQLDYFDLAADLDLVTWDNFPQASTGPDHVALNHDMMRGLKRRSYWVMEQQSGVVNWHPYNRPVPPGLVRLWTYQGFGHEAEVISYFRWRAACYGQEQYHAGLLRQDNSPTRAYREVGRLIRDLKHLPPFARKPSRVAILFDYDDWWVLQINPHQQDFSYLKVVQSIYQDLWAAGIAVDVIRRSENIDNNYQVLIVPAPIIINEDDVERWQQFVSGGGRLMMTFRAFVKEKSNNWTGRPLPATLDMLLGVQVEEYLGLPPDMRGAARDAGERLSFPYWRWAEVLVPTSGQPLLYYNQFYWRDRVAATVNEIGAGVAVYVGCWFEHMLPQTVWDALQLDEFSIPFEVSPDIEAIGIEFEDGRAGVLLLNHNAKPTAVHLHQPAVELLLDFPPTTLITLQPRDVAVLRFT